MHILHIISYVSFLMSLSVCEINGKAKNEEYSHAIYFCVLTKWFQWKLKQKLSDNELTFYKLSNWKHFHCDCLTGERLFDITFGIQGFFSSIFSIFYLKINVILSWKRSEFFLENRRIPLKQCDSIFFTPGEVKKIIPPPKTKFRLKSITIDTQKDHHFTLSWRLVNNIILGKTFSSLTPNSHSFDLHFPPLFANILSQSIEEDQRGSKLVEPRDSISMSLASHTTWQTHKFLFVSIYLVEFAP